MRYSVIDNNVKASDIHVEELYNKELDYAKEYVLSLPKDDKGTMVCPLCGEVLDEVVLEKWGMKYYLCRNTWSVILDTASLGQELIRNYFYDSKLADFRRSPEYQDTSLLFKKDSWKHTIDWVNWRVTRYKGKNKYSIINMGLKQRGFAQLLEESEIAGEVGYKNSFVSVDTKDNLENADIICAIDTLQREQKPKEYLQMIYDMLNNGGLLLLTTRAGMGFDIVTLRGSNESIYPLDHIFLPSVEAMKCILEDIGFKVLEITTPGILDMEYIEKQKDEIPREQIFQRYLFGKEDKRLLERVQTFLQSNNLSSYMRIVAKKDEGDLGTWL